MINDNVNNNDNQVITIIKENRYYFISYGVFLILGMILILFFKREYLLLELNKIHIGFLDEVFKILTFTGDGLFVILICIVLGLIKLKYGILGLASFVISGALAQMLKFMFPVERPLAFFSDKITLNLVPGVEVFSYNSFPSGHSASAFAIITILILIIKNKELGIILFFIALLIGISRIYLVQHFFIDVYFGSIIGVITAFSYYYYSRKYLKWEESSFLNFSFIKNLKKKLN